MEPSPKRRLKLKLPVAACRSENEYFLTRSGSTLCLALIPFANSFSLYVLILSGGRGFRPMEDGKDLRSIEVDSNTLGSPEKQKVKNLRKDGHIVVQTMQQERTVLSCQYQATN